MKPPDHDVELLRSISGGDRAAFARFYDQYSPLLFALALRILDDQHEAEAVLREVFMQIWDQASAWQPGLGSPCSWTVTLTRDKAVAYLHAYQNHAKLHEQVAGEKIVRATSSPTANDSLRRRESVHWINTTLAELPEDHRKAIEITFFSGLTTREAAGLLNEPAPVITARVRSGLIKLRERMGAVL